MLVLTPSRAVARWTEAPIEVGPGSVFQPLVVGPDRIPIIVQAAKAAASPELAVLSVMAHGRGKIKTAVEIALAAEKARSALPDALPYFEIIQRSLSRAALRVLEACMVPIEGFQYRSEFALKHRAAGKAEGNAEGLLAILEARGLAPSEEARRRIADCRDAALLDRWIRLAATASSVEEVLG